MSERKNCCQKAYKEGFDRGFHHGFDKALWEPLAESRNSKPPQMEGEQEPSQESTGTLRHPVYPQHGRPDFAREVKDLQEQMEAENGAR